MSVTPKPLFIGGRQWAARNPSNPLTVATGHRGPGLQHAQAERIVRGEAVDADPAAKFVLQSPWHSFEHRIRAHSDGFPNSYAVPAAGVQPRLTPGASGPVGRACHTQGRCRRRWRSGRIHNGDSVPPAARRSDAEPSAGRPSTTRLRAGLSRHRRSERCRSCPNPCRGCTRSTRQRTRRRSTGRRTIAEPLGIASTRYYRRRHLLSHAEWPV